MTSNNQTTKRFSSFLVVLMAASFTMACGDVDEFPGRLDTSEGQNALDHAWLGETNDLNLGDTLNRFDGEDLRTHEDMPKAIYIEDVQLPDHESGQFEIPDNVEIRAELPEGPRFENACGRYEDWKSLAWNTCDKFGANLDELQVFGECDGGTDQVDYSCRIELSTGEVEVELFSSVSLGGPNSCKSYDNYKVYAGEICEGGEIIAIQTGHPCDGGNSAEHFKSFTFTCHR